MNNLCIGAKLLNIACNPIIKPSTNRKHHIRFMHTHIGLVGTVHTQHANKLPVSRRVATQPHQGIRHRITQCFGKRLQCSGRIRQYHATTGIDHGALGIQQHLDRSLNLTWMPFGHWII